MAFEEETEGKSQVMAEAANIPSTLESIEALEFDENESLAELLSKVSQNTKAGLSLLNRIEKNTKGLGSIVASSAISQAMSKTTAELKEAFVLAHKEPSQQVSTLQAKVFHSGSFPAQTVKGQKVQPQVDSQFDHQKSIHSATAALQSAKATQKELVSKEQAKAIEVATTHISDVLGSVEKGILGAAEFVPHKSFPKHLTQQTQTHLNQSEERSESSSSSEAIHTAQTQNTEKQSAEEIKEAVEGSNAETRGFFAKILDRSKGVVGRFTDESKQESELAQVIGTVAGGALYTSLLEAKELADSTREGSTDLVKRFLGIKETLKERGVEQEKPERLRNAQGQFLSEKTLATDSSASESQVSKGEAKSFEAESSGTQQREVLRSSSREASSHSLQRLSDVTSSTIQELVSSQLAKTTSKQSSIQNSQEKAKTIQESSGANNQASLSQVQDSSAHSKDSSSATVQSILVDQASVVIKDSSEAQSSSRQEAFQQRGQALSEEKLAHDQVLGTALHTLSEAVNDQQSTSKTTSQAVASNQMIKETSSLLSSEQALKESQSRADTEQNTSAESLDLQREQTKALSAIELTLKENEESQESRSTELLKAIQSIDASGGGLLENFGGGGSSKKSKVKKASKLSRGIGKLSKAAKFLGPLAGLAGLAAASSEFISTKESLDQNQASSQEKGRTLGKIVGATGGGLAGGLAGAAAGASLGSVVPIIGTAIGGVIGSIFGSIGGDFIGEKIGSTLGETIASQSTSTNAVSDTTTALSATTSTSHQAVASVQEKLSPPSIQEISKVTESLKSQTNATAKQLERITERITQQNTHHLERIKETIKEKEQAPIGLHSIANTFDDVGLWLISQGRI